MLFWLLCADTSHTPESQWRGSCVSAPGTMAENTSGLSQVCRRKDSGQVGKQKQFPLHDSCEAVTTYKWLCHPALARVLIRMLAQFAAQGQLMPVPILVILCQGLECILAHSFKSEENDLKCCWFYFIFSVNHFLLGKHWDGVNEVSSPGSADGVSVHSYTFGQERNWFFSLLLCVGLAFVSGLDNIFFFIKDHCSVWL